MNRSTGFTLVESLVAMLLVLVVLAGSLALVARARNAQRVGESLARIEEALDAGFVVLVDEIRLAGYLGLAPPAGLVEGASAIGTPERPDLAVSGSCGASVAHDLPVPLAAVDAAYQAWAGMPLGCRPSPDGRHAVSADTLIVRHAAAETSEPEPGRLQLETNLRAAMLVADGAARLGSDARWHDLEVGIYYISADSTGRAGWPSLRRKRLVGGTQPSFQDEELVSGIADLQVEFGLDDPADADRAVDHWIAPASLPAGAAPRAVRLELEAWSDIQEPSQAEHRRSRRVARVVELRNGGTTP
ncbi:MAG: PilW family protein [Steroidobacteraceae bacterium]